MTWKPFYLLFWFRQSSVILGSILKYDKKLKLLDVSKNNFGDENIGFMLKGLICKQRTDMEVVLEEVPSIYLMTTSVLPKRIKEIQR